MISSETIRIMGVGFVKIDRLEAIDFTESEFSNLPVGGYFGLNGVFAGMEGTFKADVFPVEDGKNTFV